jgi:hypothetical protein
MQDCLNDKLVVLQLFPNRQTHKRFQNEVQT